MSPTYDFQYWDLPEFHAKMVKVIADDAEMKVIREGKLERFQYARDELFNIPEFVESLASFLSKEYDDDVKSSTLFPTYGSTYGFQFLLDNFFHKGDTCIFEEITYGRSYDFANLSKMNIVSVPPDSENNANVSLSHLEEAMKNNMKSELTKELPYNGLVYLLSVLNNPKGTSFTEDCCKEIVKLARKYNYLVLTDDVYQSLQFCEPSERYRRLVYYDKLDRDESGLGNVVSNATLSKIIFPSIRIGWIECTQAMVRRLTFRPEVESGAGFNTLNQRLAAKILSHKDLTAYMKELKDIYKGILHECCTYLKENLPDSVTFRWPTGSSFVWLQLPKQCNCEDVQKECLKRDASICNGTSFTVFPEKYRNYVRISVTNGSAENRMEGLRRVCEAIKVVVSH